MRRVCRLYDQTTSGLVHFPLALQYQRALVNDIYSTAHDGAAAAAAANGRTSASSDALLLVEHSSVYTLGRGGTIDNIKFPKVSSGPQYSSISDTLSDSLRDKNQQPEVYRISRGGEVTWHGPGQLVAYPLLNLADPWHKKDLRWYVYQLEETVIRTLEKLHIRGERSPVNPGVWVGDRKIAAIGISASRWITMHGIALNISCDLSMYDTIIPCGIVPAPGRRGVTSIKEELVDTNDDNSSNGVRKATVGEVSCLDLFKTINMHYRAAFSDVFQVDFEHIRESDTDNRINCLSDSEGCEKKKDYSLRNILAINQNAVDDDILIPLNY